MEIIFSEIFGKYLEMGRKLRLIKKYLVGKWALAHVDDEYILGFAGMPNYLEWTLSFATDVDPQYSGYVRDKMGDPDFIKMVNPAISVDPSASIKIMLSDGDLIEKVEFIHEKRKAAHVTYSRPEAGTITVSEETEDEEKAFGYVDHLLAKFNAGVIK